MITYDKLPISSGRAHKLRVRGARKAWQLLEGFLQECTDTVEPHEAYLECYSDIDHLRSTVEQAFGLPATKQRANDYSGVDWKLRADQFDEAVRFFDTVDPPEENDVPSSALGVQCSFRLLTPGTRQVLPGQDSALYLQQEVEWRRLLGESRLCARVASRTSANLFLSLPFDAPNSEFQQYLDFLESNLPFRLSRKHWTVWRLSKKGDKYVGRRLQLSGAA